MTPAGTSPRKPRLVCSWAFCLRLWPERDYEIDLYVDGSCLLTDLTGWHRALGARGVRRPEDLLLVKLFPGSTYPECLRANQHWFRVTPGLVERVNRARRRLVPPCRPTPATEELERAINRELEVVFWREVNPRLADPL